ncbi:MAG: hypothetical protein HKN56_06285 [Gammaproteobacteria bacterium]|nr:hypothetical protein [Gammaproteobacteria bacterium]NND54562.1 hypothetical protein [Gammaproteobacteria bacterium]
MGLFDLPGPLLTAIDNLLDFLPPLPRLALWAVITGALSMAGYWLLSNQTRVSEAKADALTTRRALSSYDGHEFNEVAPLITASLRASLRHFGTVLWPALGGSLPALAIIVWVSNQFGYILPDAGNAITVSTAPATALALAPADHSDANTEGYVAIWPAENAQLPVGTVDETFVVLPLPAPAPVMHKKLWWNALIANPAGYLEDNASVNELYLGIESQQLLHIGPAWLRGWAAPYFILLIISSLAIKAAFRIH